MARDGLLTIFTQSRDLRKGLQSFQQLLLIKEPSKAPPSSSWKGNVLWSLWGGDSFSHGTQSNINWLHRFLFMNHEQTWVDFWQHQRERYHDYGELELTFASASLGPSVVYVWSLCVPCWEAVIIPYRWQPLAQHAGGYWAAPAEGARDNGDSAWSLGAHKRRIVLHSKEVPCAIQKGKLDSFFRRTWA